MEEVGSESALQAEGALCTKTLRENSRSSRLKTKCQWARRQGAWQTLQVTSDHRLQVGCRNHPCGTGHRLGSNLGGIKSMQTLEAATHQEG